MNIYEKISAIMKDVQYLAKDDTVDYGKTKYKAISEEKVTSVIRDKLVLYGLVIFPIKQEHKREGTLSTVDVTYRIVNIENPDEHIEVVSSGTGSDTQDKGVGKAMTYAYKYMLLRTFAIPTGEDPDKISSDELDDNQKKNETPQNDGRSRVNEVKLRSLRDLFERHGIDEEKVCQTYKVNALAELTEKQHANIVSHVKEIKERCSI